jgi:hypothetical protein
MVVRAMRAAAGSGPSIIIRDRHNEVCEAPDDA